MTLSCNQLGSIRSLLCGTRVRCGPIFGYCCCNQAGPYDSPANQVTLSTSSRMIALFRHTAGPLRMLLPAFGCCSSAVMHTAPLHKRYQIVCRLIVFLSGPIHGSNCAQRLGVSVMAGVRIQLEVWCHWSNAQLLSMKSLLRGNASPDTLSLGTCQPGAY